MAYNSKETKMLKVFVISATVVLIVLGAILFTVYSQMLGPISHDHAAWSSFGSLLSGFFTVASTVVTVATLIFLVYQNSQLQKANEDQQLVTEAQLEAMRFEQYINHRRLFMDRLDELQANFEHKFIFVDGDSLYNKVFPSNGPTKLELKVAPKCSKDSENWLGVVGNKLSMLDEFLGQVQWENRKTRELIAMLIEIYGEISIRWKAEDNDGDILFFGKNTGINIYSLEEFISMTKSIYSAILLYAGNNKFTGLSKGVMRYPQDALIEYFISNFRDREAIQTIKTIPGLKLMESLYFDLDKMRADNFDWILNDSYSILLGIFRDKEGVAKLRDAAVFEEFISCILRECAEASAKIVEGSVNHSLLMRCKSNIVGLIRRNSP
ncbi:hypothetical protein [Pseudomonas alabamensis]|uniref:hypothetical protein n=1 Tax=Pseudomonas alabamensis TaxID=3064349 RepID=UPI003F64D7A6